MREVILAVGACTDSVVNRRRYGGEDFAAIADFGLLQAAARAAEAGAVPIRAGLVHTADLFFEPDPESFGNRAKMGVLAIEMEAAGLYGLAAELGARALALLTVSDQIVTGEKLSSDDRESTFDDMVHLALEALWRDTESTGQGEAT